MEAAGSVHRLRGIRDQANKRLPAADEEAAEAERRRRVRQRLLGYRQVVWLQAELRPRWIRAHFNR